MKYIIYPVSILIYFLLVYLVAKLARKKPIGFDHAFLVSLFFTPVIGLVLAFVGAHFRSKVLWWKLLGAVLVVFTLVAGLLNSVPRLPILNETIRNLYFHVPMWFAMVGVFFVSIYYSVKYLSTEDEADDAQAREAVNTGMIFGILGLLTGMVWAKFAWGAYWVNDPKLNGAAITMLVYLAYIILRQSLDEASNRARISAVYNIFAFSMMVVFIFVLPRMTDSLHPGNGGNPAFSMYDSKDLNSNMKLVFYPAVLGWGLLSMWVLQLRVRMAALGRKLEDYA